VPPRGRRPGAGDTRDDVLRAARELFAEVGFERATIRAIAARAEVDPALVLHWFGTKDDLLAAALELPVDVEQLTADLDPDSDLLGVEIARRMLSTIDANPELRARMAAMLRTGLGHEHAAAALRDLISRSVLPTLGRFARPEDRALRVTLVGTHVSGLMLGRYVLRVPGLADAPIDQVVAAVGPVLQHYLRADLHLPRSVAGPTRVRPAR
jgi:AcrR family transcriptional regulator